MIRLCSASESRASLLDAFGVEYIQSAVNFDEESVREKSPKSFVYSVVKGKLQKALEEFSLDTPILVADTVIEANGEILRKAKSVEDAREILLKQSGNKTSIISAVIYKSKSLEFIDISDTKYQFADFESDDLENYLASGEWQGKAGACMVEGFCKKYIKSVVGLESNAMGLQVEKLLPWLNFRSEDE
jgi:septum formation protein